MSLPQTAGSLIRKTKKPPYGSRCKKSGKPGAAFFYHAINFIRLCCHTCRLSAEKSGKGFAHDASDDSDSNSFDESLQTDEGDDECERVRDAERIHKILHIICVVEDQADITHE